jgi:hypothetical protein
LETAILNYLSGAILRCSRGDMIRAEKETVLGVPKQNDSTGIAVDSSIFAGRLSLVWI